MPRRLLRDGAVVVDDWRSSVDGEASGDVPLIVSFAEWQSQRDALLARSGPLGVILAPADQVEWLAPDLAHLTLAGADFPGPSEGRGYSQGRLLRERFGFGGELRARGAISRDQVFLLARCGFNSFELPESELAAGASALATFSAAYQPSNDIGLPAKPARRHWGG
jgi:uncharacterized protein (DUF934 family)